MLTRAARLLAGLIALGLLISVVPVAVLRWIDPPVTAFMILQPGAVTDLSYEWRDREDLSRNLAWAVISAEDQKFFQHHGFDFASIREAVDEYRSGDGLRGASTITQQVAKNVFLWPGQSLLRKGIEAYLTVLIEVCWPKARILEVYLNIAEFGDGIFGAEAAAQRVFRTSAASLSSAQAALLAAVLPSPKRYRAYSPTPYVRGRQLWILGQMSRVRAGANTASSGWPLL
jgi:monofunctional biosynthetic peptidoglycan transglycosylase